VTLADSRSCRSPLTSFSVTDSKPWRAISTRLVKFMIEVWNMSSSLGSGSIEHDVDARVALLPLARHLVQALVGEQLERLVADLGKPMSLTCAARAEQADSVFEKSLTYGTSGLTTTTNFAPASTAMSRLVVETMPPSTSSRSLTRTGL
jgi:hypothetical protein